MGLALLFPGQGTQHAAAMPWLDDRPEAAFTLQQLADSLDPAWRSRLADAPWTAANRNAQPLLTGMSIAAWQCLADKLPPPHVIAGYSVGELPAFCAAGALTPATALSLAHERADAMERAAAGRRMGMLAVHGLASPTVELLCHRSGLAQAIRLNHESVILGGLVQGLDAAEAELRAAGVRTTRLAIQVASHTPFMAEAVADFAHRLSSVAFAAPKCPVVCNLTAAAARSPAELARCLAGQMANPIDWDACIEAIAERGATCVLEVGPGTTLSALWRARRPDIPARSIDEFRSPEAVVAWVEKVLR